GGLLLTALALKFKTSELFSASRRSKPSPSDFKKHIEKLDSRQIDTFLKIKGIEPDEAKKPEISRTKRKTASAALLFSLCFFTSPAFAQTAAKTPALLSEAGIIITIVLLLIPVLAGLILMVVKMNRTLAAIRDNKKTEEAKALASYLKTLPEDQAALFLKERKKALDFKLSNQELSGNLPPKDTK